MNRKVGRRKIIFPHWKKKKCFGRKQRMLIVNSFNILKKRERKTKPNNTLAYINSASGWMLLCEISAFSESLVSAAVVLQPGLCHSDPAGLASVSGGEVRPWTTLCNSKPSG